MRHIKFSLILKYEQITKSRSEVLSNKNIRDLAVPKDHRIKMIESEKINKYMDFPNIKVVEHVDDGNTNCSWCTWNGTQRLKNGLERLEFRGGTETIKTIALLGTALILRKIPDI